MVNKRLLELAERQRNPSLPPEKKQPKQPKKQPRTKKSKLERDLDGKPKITLNKLEKTAVNTPTQEEYNILMQIYECEGWKWDSGNLPTQLNYWDKYKKETCIRAGNKFAYGSASDFEEEKIITLQEFYDKQKPPITSEMLKEINQWFEKNGK